MKTDDNFYFVLCNFSFLFLFCNLCLNIFKHFFYFIKSVRWFYLYFRSKKIKVQKQKNKHRRKTTEVLSAKEVLLDYKKNGCLVVLLFLYSSFLLSPHFFFVFRSFLTAPLARQITHFFNLLKKCKQFFY